MPDTVPEHWSKSEDGKWLEREFKPESYRATIDLANKVATIAEAMNHHPDMEVGYKRLKVRYTSHDSGGLTDRDFQAAQEINQLAV